jgi:hypothetical protein
MSIEKVSCRLFGRVWCKQTKKRRKRSEISENADPEAQRSAQNFPFLQRTTLYSLKPHLLEESGTAAKAWFSQESSGNLPRLRERIRIF